MSRPLNAYSDNPEPLTSSRLRRALTVIIERFYEFHSGSIHLPSLAAVGALKEEVEQGTLP